MIHRRHRNSRAHAAGAVALFCFVSFSPVPVFHHLLLSASTRYFSLSDFDSDSFVEIIYPTLSEGNALAKLTLVN
eukprot:2833321-Pleurochrysis_carterae.AAC.4